MYSVHKPVLAVIKVCSGGRTPIILLMRKLFPVPAPPIIKLIIAL